MARLTIKEMASAHGVGAKTPAATDAVLLEDAAGNPASGLLSVWPVNDHTHTLSEITDAGTAAALDVPASGDAAAGQVVKGTDTRLTDDRDPNAHTHTLSEITDAGALAAGDTASDVPASPPVGYVSTNVQALLAEVDVKKANAADLGDVAARDIGNSAGEVIVVAAGQSPDGSKYLRDDGALAVPGVGASTVVATATYTDTSGAISPTANAAINVIFLTGDLVGTLTATLPAAGSNDSVQFCFVRSGGGQYDAIITPVDTTSTRTARKGEIVWVISDGTAWKAIEERRGPAQVRETSGTVELGFASHSGRLTTLTATSDITVQLRDDYPTNSNFLLALEPHTAEREVTFEPSNSPLDNTTIKAVSNPVVVPASVPFLTLAYVTANADGGSAVVQIFALSDAMRASTYIQGPIWDAGALADIPGAGLANILPDSGSDETSHIEAALTYLSTVGSAPITGSKAWLKFRDGTYLCNNVADTTQVGICGDGGVVFQFNGTHGSDTCVLKCTIGGGDPRITYGKYRGIKVYGTGSTGEIAESGIWCNTALDWDTAVDNVQIFKCGKWAIRCLGVTNGDFRDIRVDGVPVGIYVENPPSRQNRLTVRGSNTITWADPGNLSDWVDQGYLADGGGGDPEGWGRAFLELDHDGGSGGGGFVHVSDMIVEHHLDGDPNECGVVLDMNQSSNTDRPTRILVENIRGFTDAATVPIPIIGFGGANGLQPIVKAVQASLDGSYALSIRDFTASKTYGDPYTTHFALMRAGLFLENDGPARGTLANRPSASAWNKGARYFATDTGVLSISDGSAWMTSAGGAGDMLASVYDPTSVAGDAFDMANMAEATDAKIMTAAERTALGNLGTAAALDVGLAIGDVPQFGDDGSSGPQYPAADGSQITGVETQFPAAGGTFVPTAVDLTNRSGIDYDAYTQTGAFSVVVSGRTRRGNASVVITGNSDTITWGTITYDNGDAPVAAWTGARAVEFWSDGTNDFVWIEEAGTDMLGDQLIIAHVPKGY